ncbi:inverted formin-2-like [Lissotriton helveticus]
MERDHEDEDLDIQASVFEDIKAEDDEASFNIYGGIDMNSHHEVFSTLFNKVSSSPVSVQFLSILQGLLQLDPLNSSNLLLWEALVILVNRAILLADQEEENTLEKIIERIAVLKKLQNNKNSENSGPVKKCHKSIQTEKDFMEKEKNSVTYLPFDVLHLQHLQAFWEAPKFTACFPSLSLSDTHSMWASVSISNEAIEPNYTRIEELFCVAQITLKEKEAATVKKPPKEITFLDSKRSLNLNIFLKQFRCPNEKIVEMIQKGDRSKFDVEILKQFLKLLPEKHEIENLKAYQDEKEKLSNADQFYLLLLAVPSYQLRIECMLLCEETTILLEMLQPKAKLVSTACDNILTSHRLPVFCQLILKVGNFLNYGSHTGDANGFKINTLLKLTETRANKARVNLLHHILEEVEKNHTDLLELPNDLESVFKAAGINIENLYSEITANLKKLREIQNKMSSPATQDVKEQYEKPIQDCIDSLRSIEEELESIEKKKANLAVYLCEDVNRLSLEDTFSTIKIFRDLFLKAQKDNKDRRDQAEKAERRKKQAAEEEAKRPKGKDGKPVHKGVVKVEEECIIDNLLSDIRKGFQLRKTARNKSGTGGAQKAADKQGFGKRSTRINLVWLARH